MDYRRLPRASQKEYTVRMYYLIGLGNPGEEYEKSRHNAGRRVAETVDLGRRVKKIQSDTFMNTSGGAVKKVVTSARKSERLIVVHDDIDLPLGTMKISFGRGSGGHKGVESVQRALKTKNFVRVRIGIAPAKRPRGDGAVVSFVIKPFTPKEEKEFKKVAKQAREAIELIVEGNLPKAMSLYNAQL